MDDTLARAPQTTAARANGRALATSTEDRILDGALALAASEDLGQASMESVAERAGVGRATLYRYFKNRSELLERLLAREMERFNTAVARGIAAAPDARIGLVDSFETALRLRDHPMLVGMRESDPRSLLELTTRGQPTPMETGRILWGHQLRVIKAAGLTTDIDPDVVSDVLMHTLIGYLFVPETPFDFGDPVQRRRIVETIVDGLVPQAA